MNRVLESLVQDNLLSPAQVRSVLQLHQSRGGSILDVLVQSGTIEEVLLARSLAKAFQCPLVNLTRARVSKPALRRASGEFCRRHQVMPFSLDPSSGELLVALSDPEQRTAIEALRFRNNQNIRIFIAPRVQLKEAIEYYYFSGAVPELMAQTRPAAVTKPHIPLDSGHADSGSHFARRTRDDSPSLPGTAVKERSEAEVYFLGPPATDPEFFDLATREGTGDADADLFTDSQPIEASGRGFPRAQSDIVAPTPRADPMPGPPSGERKTGDKAAGDHSVGPFSYPAPPVNGARELLQRLDHLEESIDRLDKVLTYHHRVIHILARLLVQGGILTSEQMASQLQAAKD